MKKIIVLLMCLVCFALPALAQSDIPTNGEVLVQEPERTLTVNGSATVSVQPDYAVLAIGAVTKAKFVEEAQQSNALLIESILVAIKAQGVEEADISTDSFNLSVLYDYSNSRLGAEQQLISGYQVENMLSIIVRDLDKVSTVLDASMNAGANQSYGISFQASTQALAADQALQDAVADGMRKAQLVAQAAGATLDTLVDITESQYAFNTYGNTATLSAKVMDAATPILTTHVDVSAGVTLTYTLK